jgi:hypothetical protein
MEMGEMKLSTIQKAVGCKEVKDSKNNFDAEYVFDAFAERYDKWYEKPFGKSAFKLEKACLKSFKRSFKSFKGRRLYYSRFNTKRKPLGKFPAREHFFQIIC